MQGTRTFPGRNYPALSLCVPKSTTVPATPRARPWHGAGDEAKPTEQPQASCRCFHTSPAARLGRKSSARRLVKQRGTRKKQSSTAPVVQEAVVQWHNNPPTPRKHPARDARDALTPVPSTHMDVGTQRQQDTAAQGPQVSGTSGPGPQGSPRAPAPPDAGLHREQRAGRGVQTLTATFPSSSLYSQCTQRLWHRPGEGGDTGYGAHGAGGGS